MARKPKEPLMSFDLVADAGTPILNDWLGLLGEFLPPAPKKELTRVELPEGIHLPEDPNARAILLAALYRRGLLH